jgi:hypothetical protein
MTSSVSIARRLVLTVLLLELLSAAGLIGAITVHEWRVQLKVFDASLVATTESLMGAVQDTEDESDNVMLDMRGVRVRRMPPFGSRMSAAECSGPSATHHTWREHYPARLCFATWS